MSDRFQIGMTNFDEIYSEEISGFFNIIYLMLSKIDLSVILIELF